MSKDEQITESDCCGNGCANCILDVKAKPTKGAESRPNALTKYRKYKLCSKEYQTPQLLKCEFQLNDEESADLCLQIPAAHHIMMKAPPPANITRPYSPYRVNGGEFKFEILVNCKPKGPMTAYIESLHLGDCVEFRGPVGKYEHQLNANLLVLSQGVAVTSTRRIIDEILQNDEELGRVYFAGCFENLENIIFRQEIHNYNKFWNHQGTIYLSRESTEAEEFKHQLKYKESIERRRLNEEDIRSYCEALTKSRQQFEIVISGSKIFEEFLLAILEKYIENKECIHIL